MNMIQNPITKQPLVSQRNESSLAALHVTQSVCNPNLETGPQEQILNRAADHRALAELGPQPMCCGPRWLRAKLLYSYLPFDISIFGQIKSPFFLLLTVISITPMFGIRVAFFTLILLLIIAGRPPDEYQMVTFILTFKGWLGASATFWDFDIGAGPGQKTRHFLNAHLGAEPFSPPCMYGQLDRTLRRARSETNERRPVPLLRSLHGVPGCGEILHVCEARLGRGGQGVPTRCFNPTSSHARAGVM